MPQQVNLCLPILRKQEKRFGAQSLAQALAVLLLVGGALGAAWVWNLKSAADSLQVTLTSKARELDDLRAALERAKASAGPGESVALQELRQSRQQLLQRQGVLTALSQGLFEPEHGHSARLKLVAQTIPPVVWLTQIKTDDQLLELGGYTLEPAALNDWVGKLAASPLLQGQTLNTVKVEGVQPANALVQAVPSGALAPMWSYSLLTKVATSATPSGARP